MAVATGDFAHIVNGLVYLTYDTVTALFVNPGAPFKSGTFVAQSSALVGHVGRLDIEAPGDWLTPIVASEVVLVRIDDGQPNPLNDNSLAITSSANVAASLAAANAWAGWAVVAGPSLILAAAEQVAVSIPPGAPPTPDFQPSQPGLPSPGAPPPPPAAAVATSGAKLGIIGWSAIAAGAVVVLAFVLTRRKKRHA